MELEHAFGNRDSTGTAMPPCTSNNFVAKTLTICLCWAKTNAVANVLGTRQGAQAQAAPSRATGS